MPHEEPHSSCMLVFSPSQKSIESHDPSCTVTPEMQARLVSLSDVLTSDHDVDTGRRADDRIVPGAASRPNKDHDGSY